jgi:hypothetical protein
MRNRQKCFAPAWILLFLAGLVFLPVRSASAQQQEAVVVGRIAYIEGQILRYVPDTQDWVATVKDAPFGLDDALYSDQTAKGEFIMPNGIWARIGGSTQIQLIALKNDASEMDVASGVARFYNKSADGMLKVTTPFGYVMAEPNSAFDLYVGDQSVEVIAIIGGVAFFHQKDNAKYDVVPGSGSVLADANQVGTGDGSVDAAWDDWNAERDNLWAKRTQVKGDTAKYVPPQIQDDGYTLEENGKWERVYYEGGYHEFWQPTQVDPSWRPFTVGHWTEWYGDQCWVPDEPFGYVTHHYGNWVMVNGGWYWAPPVAPVAVAGGPLPGFGWYPGRVAWIGADDNIGWVPLAPTEVYWGHRYWGPGMQIVGAGPLVGINVATLAYAPAAIVVPQASFYGVRNYSSVRITNVTINNFHSSPVVNNTVFRNYSETHNRYSFTNTAVANKPHQIVTERINANRQLATGEAKTVNAGAFKNTVATTKTFQATKQAAVATPKLTSKLVPAGQVNMPKSQVQFQSQDLKARTKSSPTLATGALGGGQGNIKSGQIGTGTQGNKLESQGIPSPRRGAITPPAADKFQGDQNKTVDKTTSSPGLKNEQLKGQTQGMKGTTTFDKATTTDTTKKSPVTPSPSISSPPTRGGNTLDTQGSKFPSTTNPALKGGTDLNKGDTSRGTKTFDTPGSKLPSTKTPALKGGTDLNKGDTSRGTKTFDTPGSKFPPTTTPALKGGNNQFNNKSMMDNAAKPKPAVPQAQTPAQQQNKKNQQQ